MGIQLQIEEMSGYLAARFTGVWPIEEGMQYFESIAEHCKRANNKKLLIDCTGAQPAVASFMDRYVIGERFQIFARYGLKVAIVVTGEYVDPQKFGETVARNRGVNIRVFTDAQTAEEWLLK